MLCSVISEVKKWGETARFHIHFTDHAIFVGQLTKKKKLESSGKWTETDGVEALAPCFVL